MRELLEKDITIRTLTGDEPEGENKLKIEDLKNLKSDLVFHRSDRHGEEAEADI